MSSPANTEYNFTKMMLCNIYFIFRGTKSAHHVGLMSINIIDQPIIAYSLCHYYEDIFIFIYVGIVICGSNLIIRSLSYYDKIFKM